MTTFSSIFLRTKKCVNCAAPLRNLRTFSLVSECKKNRAIIEKLVLPTERVPSPKIRKMRHLDKSHPHISDLSDIFQCSPFDCKRFSCTAVRVCASRINNRKQSISEWRWPPPWRSRRVFRTFGKARAPSLRAKIPPRWTCIAWTDFVVRAQSLR